MRILQCLLFGIAVLLSQAAYAKVEVIPGRGHTIYQVNVDKVTFRDAEAGGKKFTEAKLVGVDGYDGILYVEGNPEIPVVRLIVEGENPLVSVGGSRKMALPKRNVQLKPVQASAPKIRGAKAAFKFNSKAYKANAFLPAREFEVKKAGSVRGKQRLLVTLYPIAYNPATGEVQYRDYFELKVFHKAEPKASGNAQPGIAFVVGQKFAASPHVERYKAHKAAQGYRVEMIVVGRDANTPEQIRAKLQALYAMSSMKLEHVLLIGDAEDVPGYESNIIAGTTDLYYAAIDTNDYASDLHAPDIGVGRFSVATEAQLGDVVDKSIAYSRGIFRQENWLNMQAFLATNDRYEVAEGTHNYAIDTYTAPLGYVGIFPNANQAGGDKLYAITYNVPNETVQQALREGRTIIDYSGHGATTYWDAPQVTQEDVRALTDDSSLPFVISNACITGDFRIPESFAETWNRHRYGAIVFWGSMDSTYWDEDDILERRMFDGIYAQKQASFRDITYHALTEHWRHYGGEGRANYYWETYHVFGDPSLQLRTTKTNAAVVQGPTEVPVGAYPIEYTVRNEQGQPLANAQVSLRARVSSSITDLDVVLATALTDANGFVSFSPSVELNPGTQLVLVVTGQNLRETSFVTTVISPDSAWLNATDLSVNGREELLVGANEHVGIAMNVANVGLVATQGGTLAIESIDGPARVVSGTTTVGAMNPGGSVGIDNTRFVLHISPNAQNGDTIRINFVWTTTEGTTGRFAKTIKVARGVLAVAGIDFGDAANPLNGGIRPGQSGVFYVTLTNAGGETMRNASFTAAADTCLADAGANLFVDSLAPGQTVRLPVGVTATVDSACHSGDLAKFRLVGSYEGFGGVTTAGASGQFTAGVIAMREIESSNINLAIPDEGDPVEHEISVDGAGVISDIGVRIKITHTYVGDLRVWLVHPDGTAALLHDNEGGSSQNLDLNFGLGGTAHESLRVFHGKPMGGSWKVRVQDDAGQDVGKLDYVKLTVKGFMD